MDESQMNLDDEKIKPTLRYIIVCDAVGQGPDGKKTLYGLFDRIVAHQFPCSHPSLSIVIKWSHGQGKFNMSLRITDSDRNIIFQPNQPMTFELASPLATAELIISIQDIKFERPGAYWIQVFLDGRLEDYETSIFVDQA